MESNVPLRATPPRSISLPAYAGDLLARATLEHVQRDGPGSKMPRAEVWDLVARMEADLHLGRPVISPARGDRTWPLGGAGSRGAAQAFRS